MSRWMPVYEDDMTHWLWDQPQRYQWWLEIRFRAATRPGVRYVGNTNYRVNVKRGEWPVTISYLSEHWHSDDGAIKSFLEALVGDGLITINKSGLVTILSVVGFERYCFQKQTSQEPYSMQDPPDIDIGVLDKEDRLIDDDVGSPTQDNPPTSTCNETEGVSLCETDVETPVETESYPPTNIYINKNNREKKKTNTEEKIDKNKSREIGFSDQMKNSKTTLEASAMSLHCETETLIPLIEDFVQNIIVTEDWHKSLPAFKKHFLNWARLRIQNNTSNVTTPKIRHNTSNQANGGRRRGPVTPACGLNED